MKIKFVATMMLSTLLSVSAMAGLSDAVRAFDAGDYQAAYPELLSLSEEGNAVATYYLGRMYKEGLGVTADTAKAIRYFELSDKGQNPDATVELGRMAMDGEGTVQNTELGIQYLKKAAYAGSENALYELGRLYEDGTGVEKNYTYAFGFFYMGALKGDKRAQLKAAQYYLTGRGIPQDYSASMKWYTRSANQGYIPAQEEWASIRTNHPRLSNPLDAYSWYSILAAYNSEEAGQRAAAIRDEIGSGFDSNILTTQQKKIMDWRPIPASATVPPHERKEAVMPIIPGFNDETTTKERLESGVALQLDGSAYGVNGHMIEDALETMNREPMEKAITAAANGGQIKAYGYYGDLLRSRFNDDTSSVVWYRKGAEAGEPYAQYQLGKAYCEGRGINPPNVAECYSWLLPAANTADHNLSLTVRDALDSVKAMATPDELKEGEQLLAGREQKKQEENKGKTKKAPGLFNLF